MKTFRLKTNGSLKLEWLFLFFIIPFFRPIGVELEILPSAYTFFVLWLYLSLGVMVVVFLVRRPFIKFDNIGIKIYILYVMLGTILSEVLFSTDSPKMSLITFCFASIILLYLSEWNYRGLLEALHFYFVFLNVMNALFILLPFGKALFMNESIFFLGHRQSLPMLWTVALFVWGVRLGNQEKKINKKNRFFNIAYFAICTFNLFASGAAISIIVGLICFVMYILLVVKEKFGNIRTSIFYCVFIVGIVLNALLVYGNIQYYFSDFIMKYLGETVTLNGRTIIWQFFNEEISKHLITGWGYNGLRVNVGWGASWVNLDYCHNSILQELSNGGIIGLAIFIFMVINALSNIRLCENVKNNKIALCAFVSFVVIMCSESVNYYNYFMLFMILICNMWRLDKSIEEKGLVK